jgi:hypothetical protein
LFNSLSILFELLRFLAGGSFGGPLVLVLVRVETDELLDEERLELSLVLVLSDWRLSLARLAELCCLARRRGEIEAGGEVGAAGGGCRVFGRRGIEAEEEDE